MKLLVTGAGGMLARAVIAAADEAGYEVAAYSRARLDITDALAVETTIRNERPGAVVHCAAYTRVDDAESDEWTALGVNCIATRNVARACAGIGARFVYPSTDYVFDGTARSPYLPNDTTKPINMYGFSKSVGEQAAAEAGSWLVVRTSWLFGSGGRNFVSTILERAREGQPLRVVNDQVGSPTWTADLARALLALLGCNAASGIYHACNGGQASWYDLACAAVELAGLQTSIEPVTSDEFPRPALRPRYSVLDCSTTEALIGHIPHWKDSLARALEVGL